MESIDAGTHAQYRQIHIRAQYAEYWRSYTRAQYSVCIGNGAHANLQFGSSDH